MAAARCTCNGNLPVGAPVSTADGQQLGAVVAASTHVLVVERGRWFTAGYVFLPQAIASVDDGAFHLTMTMDAVVARSLAG